VRDGGNYNWLRLYIDWHCCQIDCNQLGLCIDEYIGKLIAIRLDRVSMDVDSGFDGGFNGGFDSQFHLIRQDKMSLTTISAVPLILIELRRNQYIFISPSNRPPRTPTRHPTIDSKHTMDDCLLEHASSCCVVRCVARCAARCVAHCAACCVARGVVHCVASCACCVEQCVLALPQQQQQQQPSSCPSQKCTRPPWPNEAPSSMHAGRRMRFPPPSTEPTEYNADKADETAELNNWLIGLLARRLVLSLACWPVGSSAK
jgi:hypothetical protein